MELVKNPQKAKAYNSQVALISPEVKEALKYWPTDRAGDSFTYLTARFQKAVRVRQQTLTMTVDGFFGPDTQKELLRVYQAPRPQNYLICDNHFIEVPFKVINYEQDPKWSGYGSGNFRWRDREVNLFILHWDGLPNSATTHKVLTRPDRDGSVHFYLDGDEEATVYQAYDLGFVRCWHAGSKGNCNARSGGVEICNPYYTYANDKKRPRAVIKDIPVNGNLKAEYLDFYPEQKERALQLCEALVEIESIAIPKQLPKRPEWESEFLGDDEDAPGSVIRGEITDETIWKYTGIGAHYMFEEGKIDTGVHSLWPVFLAAGW